MHSAARGWRLWLVACLIVLAGLYSLPNFFGEDPAIQISASGERVLSNTQRAQLMSALHDAGIVLRATGQIENNSLLIRLRNDADQMHAQSIAQALLGEGYTVALNLAARTPTWLQWVGGKPMRLGLDLRGGIHFLLKVDTQTLIHDRISADVRAMATALRLASLRYNQLDQVQPNTIQLGLVDRGQLPALAALLAKQFPDYTQLSQSSGPVKLLLKPSAAQQLKQQALEQNLTTLRTRVNALGVGEPVIQQQGVDQISVDLPGVQDTARAKSIIGKVATIRMQLVDVTHDVDAVKQSGIVPFDSELQEYEGHPILLNSNVLLMGSSIQTAQASVDQNGRPAVDINLGSGNVAYFNQVTGENIGRPMAVVYVETKVKKQMHQGKVTEHSVKEESVISVATINSALGSRFQITGLSSMRYAQNLALLLRSGAYTAPVSFIQEQVVGPSLGQKNIDQGVLSCLVGSLVVFVFMLFYYRVMGIFAVIALILNVMCIVSAMSLLGATLTLPGIAGIVLTVGMAVDANVLINERIREELRAGHPSMTAINAGYERAFSTIVDANVTTLIVAIILYSLGTGSVQGFAVTLIIGLLTSMVTAIFVTRTLVCRLYQSGRQKRISIGI